MGSVRYNKGRGRWFIDYVAATGQRMRQTIGPGDEGKRLAKKVLAQREAEARLGIHRLPASRTARFEEFAADWLARSAGRNLAPKTSESYESIIRCHLVPGFGGKTLGAITKRDVELFLAEARTARKRPTAVSPKTAGYALTILKAILADAVDHGHLQENPAAKVRPPVRPDRDDEMQILQPAEIVRLLEVAEEPWRMLYTLALQTGMRRGELLGLRWGDLDLQGRRLQVRRSLHRVRNDGGENGAGRYVVREAPLKTRHSRRTIDLSPSVVEGLLAHPAGDDPKRDFVFRARAGGPLSPDAVDAAFKRHLALAGVPTIRFHDLRHSHASLLIAAGVHPKAIQARLGHSSITVTMDRYGHLMPSAFQGVGERLDALLGQGNIKATSTNAGPSESLKPASVLAD